MSKWRNRIVRYEDVDPQQLLANPANWRVHPQAQKDALAGSIAEVGYVDAIKVQDGTDVVVDGHLRVAMALQDEQPTIPVQYVDLNDAEVALVLAFLDPIAAMATADREKLAALLDELSTGDQRLQTMLDQLAVQEGITLGAFEGLTDPDDVPDVVEPITKPGDLWLLGQHRLLCGDSTNAEDVQRLMAGATAELVWTDPPYGVGVGDKNKWLNTVSGHSDGQRLVGNRVTRKLTNDDLDADGMLAMLRGAFGIAVAHCTAGASWYVAAPAGPHHLLFGLTLNELGIFRQTIQWVKNNATLSPMGVSYHWQAEPIFYGWLPNAAKRFYGDRKQTTVWEIDRPTKSPEHPTMKPVELVARAIEHASRPDQVVLDPFLGSGTTLIAAEQLHRICYGMEIDPHYCDVIVTRWQNFTGQTATLEAHARAAD